MAWQRGMQLGAQPVCLGDDLGRIRPPDPADQPDRDRCRCLLLDDDPQVQRCPKGRIEEPVQEALLLAECLRHPVRSRQTLVLTGLKQIHCGVDGDREICVMDARPLAPGLQSWRRSNRGEDSPHGAGARC